MNRVDLVGRLVRDPELRYTTSNMPVVQFTLAINRTFTNQAGERDADFINVVVWDKQAENVNKYVTKGRLVSVEGRLRTRNYDDKDGKKVYVTEVVANRVGFLESKKDETNNLNSLENTMPSGSVKAEEIDNIPMVNDPFANEVTFDENDLPF